jgi:hypothetical protein
VAALNAQYAAIIYCCPAAAAAAAAAATLAMFSGKWQWELHQRHQYLLRQHYNWASTLH